MEKELYFITDLDRTLIHSKNKGYKCVESIGEKEITYMTEKSYSDFLNLLELEHFKFIPCTMRNIKQTLRVDFIREYNPKIIICSNGAQIYVDGELDNSWEEKMREIKSNEEVQEEIAYIESLNLTYGEVRNIEGFYVTIKCNSEEEAKINYLKLVGKFHRKIKVIHIGVKIFIIDERINKINAVDYIIEKYDIKKLFTAGDSEVDREFTKRGISIIPKHSSFKHENSYITEKEGIFSTEDIINYLRKFC